MRIGFNGRIVDEPRIRVGFIGCGSHSFRNVYPTFQFAPVELVSVCDLDLERAQAFARQFGAERAYTDYHQMLEKEKLDAVFIVTGYDKEGRPTYPKFAADCLAAGCHVWMEKPPAATSAELEALSAVAHRADRQVMAGLKKMFFPANRKAKEIMDRPDFGAARLVTLQYPQSIPVVDDMRRYLQGREGLKSVINFLDHLCHPASLMVYLLGMPATLCYHRAANGSGIATFSYASGAVASIILPTSQTVNGGFEHTEIFSETGHRIVVDNNTRVSWVRPYPVGYGKHPDFYSNGPEHATDVWEPEFSLGQLYNKGLFVLGYYGEVNEFASAILQKRPLQGGTLQQAWQVTRIFEAFAEGPEKVIRL